MGAVFLGVQPGLEREVAIKIVRSGRSTKEATARFEKEARALAAVEHQNLVRLLDFGEEQGIRYLVMEYLRGTPLSQAIRRRGRLPAEHARTILFCIAEAIQAIHDAGMLHRDVKPDNVMIDEHGRPVLMDLGLARLDDEATADPLEGRAVGTPLYMAPEIARHERGDTPADWYSWGATLFEALDGDPPFARDEIVPALSGRAPWPIPPRPGCDPDGESLAALASWCLRPSPEKRPTNLEEIRSVMSGERPAPVPVWSTTRPRTQDERPRRRAARAGLLGGWLPLGSVVLAASLTASFYLGWFSGRSRNSLPPADSAMRLDLGPGSEMVAVLLAPDTGTRALEVDESASGTLPRQVPIGPEGSVPFTVSGPFRARLVDAEGNGGAWSSYPAPPRGLPEPWDHRYTSEGIEILGTGAAPEGDFRLASGGAAETVGLVEVVRAEGAWSARLRLPPSWPGQGAEFRRTFGQGSRIRVPIPDGLLDTFTGEATWLARLLETERTFVTDLRVQPDLKAARRAWLRLRSHALGGWRGLDPGATRAFTTVLRRLIAEEEGEPRWTRASSFVGDLASIDPESARALSGELGSDSAPRNLRVDMRSYVFRFLKDLSDGLGEDDDRIRSLVGGSTSVDRGVVASGLRGAFLPSPLATPRPEAAIAWALWGTWQIDLDPGGSDLSPAAQATVSGAFDAVAHRRRHPDWRFAPFAPGWPPPPPPPPAIAALERERAFASLLRAPPDRIPLLVRILALGLLPTDRSRATPARREELARGIRAALEPALRARDPNVLPLWEPCLEELRPELPPEAGPACTALDGLFEVLARMQAGAGSR